MNWSNLITWLPLLLEILDNMCIVIISCPVCDVTSWIFEIKLSFLVKLFSYLIKKSGQKFKYPKTKAVTQTCSVKKVFLEISQNSQENTCARVSFLIKLQAAPATLLKKRLRHRCFPVNLAKFLRTTFFTEHLWWLLLPRTERAFNMKWKVYFFSLGLSVVRNTLRPGSRPLKILQNSKENTCVRVFVLKK